MTQSKDDKFYVDIDSVIDLADDFTVDTTTYIANGDVTDTITVNLDEWDDFASSIDLGSINIGNKTWDDGKIYTHEVENMCNEYPALEKAWRNFKSIYDMVKQDYEGKKKTGEIDDDLPF